MTFNGQTFNVLVQIGINLANGLITAQFFSIDPTTQLPPDVLTGFLPPEDGTGRGMGHISYTVSPKAGLPTGTQIRNVADVSFDEQPIIATDQVSETDPTQGVDPAKQALVTIDAGAADEHRGGIAAARDDDQLHRLMVGQRRRRRLGHRQLRCLRLKPTAVRSCRSQTETTDTSATFTGRDRSHLRLLQRCHRQRRQSRGDSHNSAGLNHGCNAASVDRLQQCR